MPRKLITTAAIALALTALALPSTTPSVSAAPEPAVVPVTWELTFKNKAPERIIVDGKSYWYMRYTVINNSGRDVLFTPDFELLTDTGQSVSAFKDVPKDVFSKIKELHNNKFLLSHTDVLGKLLQGEDNAKDGVIIFANVEPEARLFQFFISGISGETAEVKNPITGKITVIQKSLVLEYALPGEAINIDPSPIFKSSKWVMK